jgi:hypothetical protein
MSESGNGNPTGPASKGGDNFNQDIWEIWEREIRRTRDRERQRAKREQLNRPQEGNFIGRYKHPKQPKSIAWSDTTPSETELEFGLYLSAIASELVILLESKQKDYGPNSVNGAPGGPITGLLVRLHDKFSRANNLASKNKTPNNEPLRETFIDIAGYALLAIMVIDGKFPKE